ncbi:hypothetical protein HZI73_07005 [Vallitalea pronyensis]|uniref:Uncharacterized protein n=1 Tax=Vallitalea pronyensis TaxID=1348613 RepID=A0A8J8SG64_9FIRM|nr:hypothetical protein [Vallitalea pronyensis]QUI22062.1 hypothetical protein HZI73_07005 [Vallitalea pronyensis]
MKGLIEKDKILDSSIPNINANIITKSSSNKGLDIIQISKNKHKFMIIDDKIVWYVGIDILGANRSEESLIRIINEELGNVLIDIIEQNKNLS